MELITGRNYYLTRPFVPVEGYDQFDSGDAKSV